MHMSEIIQRDGKTFSFEFFPPRTDTAWDALLARMGDFSALKPSFVSVTYGAGGSTRQRTNDLVVRLKQEGGVDPIPHLTCIKHTRDEIESILERYAEAGISNILTLRGDHPIEDVGYDATDDEYQHAIDLVRHIKAFNDSGRHPSPRGFGIGVAGFPEGHPETPNRLKQLEYLKQKVDAGADWVTSQMFFDNASFHDWCERCELEGIDVPLIAGIMPITGIRTMRRMADLAGGTNFPAKLQRRIHRHQDDDDAVRQVGVQWATEQCNELLDHGVAGIHFYTLNQSDATLEIFRGLGANDTESLRR
tara:strand:- start:8905 stop:9822 length:918 start_codon:yes stop_codon:yes gene_type:complete